MTAELLAPAPEAIAAPPAPARWTAAARRAALALVVWGALVAGAHLWGEHLLAGGQRMKLALPPLFARLEPRPGPGVVPAVAVAGLAVWAGPGLAARLPWRRLLVAAALLAAAWAVALALVDGPDGLTRGVASRFEYLGDVPAVASPGDFLETFTQRLPGYRVHTQGHPPGLLLVLWALDRIGLGGAGWAAALFIAGGTAAVPAALVALRAVAGETPARAAAPFLAVVPAAVWLATSADALYAGVGATGVALLALAARRGDRRGDGLSVLAGVVFGFTAHLTYGAVVLAPVAVVVCAAHRRLRPLLLSGAGALAVTGAFAAAGFWWLDGLAATRRAYWAGVASQRPFSYFLVANLAAFAVATGPAVAVALGRLRNPRVWLVVAAGLAGVAAADLSGMSKGEVERIWLPLVPWVVAATAAFGPGRKPLRWWLGAQAAPALALQVAVWTPW